MHCVLNYNIHYVQQKMKRERELQKLTRMLPAFKSDTNILQSAIQTFGLPSIEFLHMKDACLLQYDV